MKELYLVRHAKSSWDYLHLSDFERPLNKRGKRNAPDMGSRLANRKIKPDLMLSSPANRALTTCEIIAKEIGYDSNSIATDDNIYHAGSSTLLEVLQTIDDQHKSVMLFGHNPGFTDFANRLAQTDIYNIPTCGVFACAFEIESWKYVSFGTARLLFYDYPKNKGAY